MPFFSKANSDECWLSAELKRTIEEKRTGRAQHLKHLVLADFHELVFRLGACAASSDAKKPMKVADSGSLSVSSPISMNGAAMLRHWPDGFTRIVKQIQIGRRHKKTWQLGEALGPLYDEIYEGLPGDAFQFVREALEKFLLEHWQGPLALRNRRLSKAVVLTHKWLPLHEASARSNLRRSTVQRAAEAGDVGCRYLSYQSGRLAQVIDNASLEASVEELRSATTICEAAKRLGLSEARVLRMINTGLLKVLGGVPRAGMPWLIEERRLQELYVADAETRVLNKIGEQQISLAQLVRSAARDSGAFESIIRATLGGTIKIAGTLGQSSRISDWIFERQAIKTLLRHSPSFLPEDLTVAEVGKALKVKQEVAYALVQSGVVKSYARKINGRLTRFIRLRDVDAFRDKFVFGSELARWLACSPKSLAHRLLSGGFKPIGGPSLALYPCRQYYWQLSKKLRAFLALP